MKKKIVKLLILAVFVFLYSCERESHCQTETVCYSDGNGGQSCIERPIPGTCVDDFRF